MFNFGEMGVRFKLELAVTGALFKAKDFLVDFGLGHVIKLDLLRQNIRTEFEILFNKSLQLLAPKSFLKPPASSLLPN